MESKRGKKPFPLPGWNRRRRCRGSGSSRGASGSLPDAALSFVWKTAAPPPPSPQTAAEKPRQPITRVAASPGQTVCWQSAGTRPGSTESEGDKGGKSFYHISNGSVCCSRQKETRQRLPARQFPSDWRYSCGGSHALSVRAWTASASHISILMWINAGDNGGSVLHA